MPKLGSGEVLKCSFCGKTQRQVAKLIAGPGVYICDECIDLCNRIIDDKVPTLSERDLDTEIQTAARSATEAVHRLRILAEEARAGPDSVDPE